MNASRRAINRGRGGPGPTLVQRSRRSRRPLGDQRDRAQFRDELLELINLPIDRDRAHPPAAGRPSGPAGGPLALSPTPRWSGLAAGQTVRGGSPR